MTQRRRKGPAGGPSADHNTGSDGIGTPDELAILVARCTISAEWARVKAEAELQRLAALIGLATWAEGRSRAYSIRAGRAAIRQLAEQVRAGVGT